MPTTVKTTYLPVINENPRQTDMPGVVFVDRLKKVKLNAVSELGYVKTQLNGTVAKQYQDFINCALSFASSVTQQSRDTLILLYGSNTAYIKREETVTDGVVTKTQDTKIRLNDGSSECLYVQYNAWLTSHRPFNINHRPLNLMIGQKHTINVDVLGERLGKDVAENAVNQFLELFNAQLAYKAIQEIMYNPKSPFVDVNRLPINIETKEGTAILLKEIRRWAMMNGIYLTGERNQNIISVGQTGVFLKQIEPKKPKPQQLTKAF